MVICNNIEIANVSLEHFNDNIMNQMKFEWKVWYIIQKMFLRNIIKKIILSNLDTIWERYENLIFRIHK
jgi:hypothetical protein